MSSRRRRLDSVVARLQLQYGPRAIRRAGPSGAAARVACIPTAFPELDAALAESCSGKGGGLPRGRITEIVGPATSGKVTLAAKVVASAHRARDALAAWFDVSRTCDPDYLCRCGVDLERLLVVRPEAGHDALPIALHLVESHALAVLVFDGVADLSGQGSASPTGLGRPGWETAPTGSDEALSVGALERLGTVVTCTATAVLFLTEPVAHCQTLAHLATIRLQITREDWLIRDGDIRGYESQVQILKNKIGRSGIVVPIRITFNGTVRGDGL